MAEVQELTPAQCREALGYFMLVMYRYQFSSQELLVLLFICRKSFYLGRTWTRPLTQRQIATMLGMHETDLSRAIRGGKQKGKDLPGLIAQKVVHVTSGGCYGILLNPAFWEVVPRLNATPQMNLLEAWSDQAEQEYAEWFKEPRVVDELVGDALKNLPTRSVSLQDESAVRPQETHPGLSSGRDEKGGVLHRESVESPTIAGSGVGPLTKGQPQPSQKSSEWEEKLGESPSTWGILKYSSVKHWYCFSA